MSPLLLAALLQAAPVTGHVRATTIAQDVWTVVTDPAYYDVRKHALWIKTKSCAHQSTDEPVVLLVDPPNDRALLLFDAGDRCEVVKVAEDRDGLER